jgi:ribosomal peptide maturation radical SAM protein 1
MDIVLVNMPMAPLLRPSIALGILKSILRDAGFTVHVLYANLAYADYIGLKTYLAMDRTKVPMLLGDWVFSKTAFPDFETSEDQYFEYLRSNDSASEDIPEIELYKIRDMSHAFVQSVADDVLKLKPTIVGCTSMFQQNTAAISLLKKLKDANPEIITMMGGANCETDMGRVLHTNCPWIDYIVSGEADDLIVDLCKKIFQQGNAICRRDIPYGVFAPVHRREGYQFGPNGVGLPRALVAKLPSVVPDYDDYFDQLGSVSFSPSVHPSIPIETSRGCWWGAKHHCTFCGLNGMGMSFRSKAAQEVLAEIRELVSKYQVRRFQAVDNILDTKYLRELLPHISPNCGDITIFYEVKANLKKEHVRQLAESGVCMIQPGIESLSTNVLKLMRKGCTATQNILLLKWCLQYGVYVTWNLIYGFPGEKEEWYEEVAELLPALEHLQPGGLSALRYDRFSPYFNDPEAWGLQLSPNPAYSMVYPFDNDELANIAYFFVNKDQKTKQSGLDVQSPALIKLKDEFARWYKRVYPRRFSENYAPGSILILKKDVDGRGVVTDTRSCASSHSVILSRKEVAALEFLDSAPTMAGALDHLVETQNASSEESQAILNRLIFLRFAVKVDDRCIGLVLEAPLRKPGYTGGGMPVGYFSTANRQPQRSSAEI